MKVAIIGCGQLGLQLFNAANGTERLLIDSRESLPADFSSAELGYSNNIEDASKCDLVALAVPPSVCEDILNSICPLMNDGSIVLNFPTKSLIHNKMKNEFSNLYLVEAKLLGSAVALSKGLDHLVILSQVDDSVVEKIKSSFSLLNFIVGDYLIVPKINNLGMKIALSAAIEMERELKQQGLGEEIIKATIGGLMTGSLMSYAANTLGEFGLEIVEELNINQSIKQRD